MADADPTLRELTVARLARTFGRPAAVGPGFHWSVPVGSSSANPKIVSIALNSWHTPQFVRVWVFDSRKPGLAGTKHFDISSLEELEPTIQRICHAADTDGRL